MPADLINRIIVSHARDARLHVRSVADIRRHLNAFYLVLNRRICERGTMKVADAERSSTDGREGAALKRAKSQQPDIHTFQGNVASIREM